DRYEPVVQPVASRCAVASRRTELAPGPRRGVVVERGGAAQALPLRAAALAVARVIGAGIGPPPAQPAYQLSDLGAALLVRRLAPLLQAVIGAVCRRPEILQVVGAVVPSVSVAVVDVGAGRARPPGGLGHQDVLLGIFRGAEGVEVGVAVPRVGQA